MTSQRRRPEQTQRRLAIQASSRRSRNAAPTDNSTTGWDQEAIDSHHRYDEPIRQSFRPERFEEPRQLDASSVRSRRYREERMVDNGRYGHAYDSYQDERMVDSRRYANAYDSYPEDRLSDDHRYTDGYDSYRQPETWDSREPYGQSRGRSELDQDLEAMGKVWSMIRQGAVRMLGEVGRQY